jgi:hypothetical protein
MSLYDMRCDQCGEIEPALFRAKAMGELSPTGWWCEACLHEAGQDLDEETLRLVNILKRRNPRDEH